MKYSRRAYLVLINNVRRGLMTRTRILNSLSIEKWKTISEIAEKVHVTYNTILYHLKNMEREEIVIQEKDGAGWKLLRSAQTPLSDFFKSKTR